MPSLQYKYGSYYAIFSRSGRKKWIKLGNINKKDAQSILKQLELEYTKDRLNIWDIKYITLFDYIDEYLTYCKSNKAHSTYQRELKVIKQVKKFFDDIPVTKLSDREIENYKSKRMEDGLSRHGTNKELSVLRFMLNKAREWNYLDNTPRIKLLKIPKQPPKGLSLEEMEKLIESASRWLRPMIIVLRNTGVRMHELLNMKFEDINFDKRFVIIRSNKTKDYRSIPMNKELYNELLWLKENYPLPHLDKIVRREDIQREYVFCKEDGTKINSIKKSFKNACKKANIKATPHTLRHTFASQLIMKGVDVISVKELLGHSRLSTTLIYTHIDNRHKTKAVGNLKW